MRIIVGLGNPGREYAATRHNVGFMTVTELARRLGFAGIKRRFRAELLEGPTDFGKVVLAAPQTFMNLSGHSVREIVQWHHAPISDLLVLCDDLDLPFGALRLRGSGSAGGHNGLASIIEQLGTKDVPRLRIGIGRGRSSASAHVLSRFSPAEEAELRSVIDAAADAALLWAREGVISAMNQVNVRAEPTAKPARPVQAPGAEQP